MAYVSGVLDSMKVCILVPVYNEHKAIAGVVESLRQMHFDVFVVDDGSKDDSGRVAQEKGAVVITHECNQGKGKSLQDGFDYILRTNQYDALITLDGDGQHDIHDIKQFLSRAEGQPDCIVTGTRMANPKGMPWIRLMTNRFMSWLISLICKQSIPDTQCGYRLISCGVLRQLSLTSNDFQIETEVLIQAARKGFKIHSVPIQTIYRGEKSKINPLIDTVRFIVFIAKEIMCVKK